MTEKVCFHCGKSIKGKNLIVKSRGRFLCPYCLAVLVGGEDEDWMPELRLEDTKKKT